MTSYSQEGKEFCKLKRIGDDKEIELSLESLETKFDELTEEERDSVLEFLNNNPTTPARALTYTQGLLKWAQVLEAGRFLTEREILELNEQKQATKALHNLHQEFENLVNLPTAPNVTPPQFIEDVLKELNPPKKGRPKKAPSTQPVSLEVGMLLTPSDADSWSKILLPEETKKTIQNSMTKLKLRSFLDNDWNLNSIDPMSNRSILNFYGPPGTGKTLSAKAIAKVLGKKLIQVDYSQVESKWVGETGKNIQKVFQYAKQFNAVILFDEADSLVSKRNKSASDEQNANHVNQSRNVFMQELDRFDGVVILTTNLFENYDEALLRRVQQHVEFSLPTEEIRKQLFKNMIPKEVPVASDLNFDELASLSDGLSGGNIQTVCLEAIVAVACESFEQGEEAELAKSKLTQVALVREIEKVKSAKEKHSGGTRKTMGFNL